MSDTQMQEPCSYPLARPDGQGQLRISTRTRKLNEHELRMVRHVIRGMLGEDPLLDEKLAKAEQVAVEDSLALELPVISAIPQGGGPGGVHLHMHVFVPQDILKLQTPMFTPDGTPRLKDVMAISALPPFITLVLPRAVMTEGINKTMDRADALDDTETPLPDIVGLRDANTGND